MSIIGCDLHSRYQVVAGLEAETGEIVTRRLEHEDGEARRFYAQLPKRSLIGIEATGCTQWFERMLAEMGHELWVGDPCEIRARVVRRQITDTRAAEHLLDLLLTERFPRIWVPTPEERDLRQLLRHRDRLVRIRTSVKNQLQFLARSQGVYRRGEAGELGLDVWASRRREELSQLFDHLEPRIAVLDRAVAAEAGRRPEVVQLMKQKGVGPVVGLAFVLTVGPVERFRTSRQLVSYLGLNPSEHSSGGHQRLGHISKQGNSMMRWLLVEAGQTAARFDPELRRRYLRLKFRRGAKVAKVAVARRLAVRLYGQLRQARAEASPVRMPGSSAHSMVEATPSTL